MNADLINQILIFAVPVILAITLHEAAHGFVALHFGDTTAKDAGRVTLNPLKHIDPFGTIFLPLLLIISQAGFVFGWAKPVPVNFRALKNPRWDMIWVAIAGPAMNLLLAVISVILLRIVLSAGDATVDFLLNLLVRSVQLNVILAVFNMLPLPPLDGSKVIAPFLPGSIARPYLALERYGMLILIALLVIAPILAQRSGSNFDIFGVLVQRPAFFVIRGLMSLAGLST